MPEIMPSEARNVRPPQQLRPRRLESGLYSKDMLTAARLFAPASEHTHSLLIQSDVTCLATLRVPAFDREELMVEVDGSQRNLRSSPRRSPVFMERSTAGVK